MNDWKTVKLGDLTKLASGKFNPTKNLDDSYKYPTYGGNGITGMSKDFLIDFETLIIGRVGAYCGSIHHTNEKIWVTDNAMYIKECSDEIILKFLSYFLHSINLHRFASQSGQPKLTQKPIENLEIKLPPIEIQKQIVSILENAESLKQKREETNKETQRIIQSIFYDMFGNPVKNEKEWDTDILKAIADIERNSISPEDIIDNASYVGLENIQSGSGKILKINKVKNGDLKSSKFKFNNNHILYGKLRPYLNKIAFPTFQGVCSTDILPILPKKNSSNKKFIGCLLKLPYFIALATDQSTGANLPRISPKSLENFKIIVPPIKLQEEFARRVQLIESIQSKQESSTNEINTLFDALMQKAFKGELVE